MLGAGITKELRKHIYKREGYACALCDSTRGLQIHHVVPRGRGGSDEAWNLIALCSCCHALAHGQVTAVVRETWDGDIDEFGPADCRQAMVEYLADHYAEMNALWTPKGLVSMDGLDDIEFKTILRAQYEGKWPKRWGG